MSEETTEPLPESNITLTQILSEVRSLGHRLQAVETRLESLEDKFEARSRERRQELRDTRQINFIVSRTAWVHDDLETRIEKLERQVVTETSLQP